MSITLYSSTEIKGSTCAPSLLIPSDLHPIKEISLDNFDEGNVELKGFGIIEEIKTLNGLIRGHAELGDCDNYAI